MPNVTPDPETGIGTWRDKDPIFRFRTSLLPPICNRIAGTKKSGAGSPWD